ncbi:MAG: MFS transporter [Thermosynechococcaceae cyanobacterium]
MKSQLTDAKQRSSALATKIQKLRLLQPNYPVRPDRTPFFYGWVIVAAATLGILMSIPGQTMGVSVFTDHLLEATGLSRLALSNAYFVGTLTSGLCLPFGGILLDRLGARVMVVVSSVWLALTLVYLSGCDRIATFLSTLTSLSLSTTALIVLTLGFISLRFSGQGMLTLTSRNMLGKWFDRQRGLASGISGIFTSLGFAATPLILKYAIDGAGWRGTWLGLAAVVGLGMGLIGWLFFRDNPEECGLQMDGTTALPAPTAAASLEPIVLTQHEFTRGEALKTLAFWATTMALSSQALVATGITFHIVDLGATVGLSEEGAVSWFLPTAVVSTLVGYSIGVAADRLNLKLFYLAMMMAQGIGFMGVAHLGIPLFRIAAIVGLGISGGCFGTLSAVTLPRYFGRVHLGAISGVQMMSIVIASAIGPSFLAVFKAQLGSYQTGLYFCCGFPAIAFLLILGSRNPQRSLPH